MITILEGPDFAGKTTFAQQLGGRIVHNGPPPVFDTKFKCYDFYEEQLLAVDPREDVVFDRLWLGELIYGPIYRCRSQLTFSDHEVLTDLCLRLGVRLVYMNTPWQTVVERFHGERGDEMIKQEDQLDRIWRQYRVLLNKDDRWEKTA